MISVLISTILANPAPPVLVFVLAGQSNMVGHGFIAADPKRNGGRGSLEYAAKGAKSDPKLKSLLNKDGTWRVRDDVWIQYFDRKGKLTVGYGAGEDCIGPELGFGTVVGNLYSEPVFLIKIAWGGKSLAVDFRPPSSGGTVGPNYKEVVLGVKNALANMGTNFPELKGKSTQIVGFGWHQGWNDRVDAGFVREYEQNMVNFIKDMRNDLGAPKMAFVIGETGMGGLEERDPVALELMKAQEAAALRPEFKGNVAFVGTRAFWRTVEQSPISADYHWNNNGETYYLIGDAMGRAMTSLIKGGRK